MGLKINVIAVFLLLFISSCGIMKDDMLGLNRMDYSGMDIKLNGYWWKKLSSTEPSKEIYFFYRDGTVMYGGATPISELVEQESYYLTQSFYDLSRKSKTGWGVFHANSDEIEFETWGPSSGGPLKTNVRSGVILNDSTFLINSLFSNYDDKTEIQNDTFHFKEFSPKPDSTNVFIK